MPESEGLGTSTSESLFAALFFIKRSWYKKPHERVLAFYLEDLSEGGTLGDRDCPMPRCAQGRAAAGEACPILQRGACLLPSLSQCNRAPQLLQLASTELWCVPHKTLARSICLLLSRATGSGHPRVLRRGCLQAELQSAGSSESQCQGDPGSGCAHPAPHSLCPDRSKWLGFRPLLLRSKLM